MKDLIQPIESAMGQPTTPILEFDQRSVSVQSFNGVVRAKSRCFWAQRQSGVTPLEGLLLDLIAVANSDDQGVDIEELAEAAQIPSSIVRRHAVRLVQDGWLSVNADSDRKRLHTTEKSQNALSALMMMQVEH
jgi:DNA-binding MarR family transcriptional regulator